MATYYSACRRFGSNVSNCPVRGMGGRCIDCDNAVWVLRQKSEENTKNSESGSTNTQENLSDS